MPSAKAAKTAKPVVEPSRRPLAEARAEALLLLLSAEDLAAAPFDVLPAALAAVARDEAARRRFKAGRAETLAVAAGEGKDRRRVYVAGLGPRAACTPEILRQATAAGVRLAQADRAASLAAAVPAAAGDLDGFARTRAVAEGFLLGQYRFERFVTDADRHAHRVGRLILAGLEGKAAGAALEQAEAVAQAAALVRDLVNLPAADLYPETFVAEARRAVRGTGLALEVLGPRELEREKMGALLAVGKGSEQPPRLVHVTYKPKGRAKARLAFVGKGVTFDAGGYNLKPGDSMDTMKCDMAGAAAVLGALVALARLGAPVEVHGIVGLVENLVSGRAFKPGDVLTSRAGKTIEINNTDAEGRLVLADALDYAARLRPAAIVDLATLTGACVVALGPQCSGLFTPDDALAETLSAAARRAGEKVWRLPLLEEYREQLKSDVADMKNTGQRWGGAITAALFLQSFAPKDVPWAHLDIAGPAFSTADHAFWGKGGTAAGMATLIEYALSV